MSILLTSNAPLLSAFLILRVRESEKNAPPDVEILCVQARRAGSARAITRQRPNTVFLRAAFAAGVKHEFNAKFYCAG